MKRSQIYYLSFWLSVRILVILIMVAKVIESVLFDDWGGMIIPFLFLFMIVAEAVGFANKLHKKKVFVVFKDKDW